MNPNALIEAILAAKHPAAVGHENPDGDAYGSVLALYNYVSALQSSITPVLKGPFHPTFSFLSGFQQIQHGLPQKVDLCILLDATDFHRTGFGPPGCKIVRVDHHIGGESYSELDLVDSTAQSTTLIILRAMTAYNDSAVTPEVARCILAGLMTDTTSLRARMDANAYRNVAYLVEKGAEPEQLGNSIYRSMRPEAIKLYARALSTLATEGGGSLAHLTIRHRDWEETGAVPSEAERVVDFAVAVRGADTGIKFQEVKPGVWKVSLRSKEIVDVQRIAASLGGGGHLRAAGVTLEGTEAAVKARVMAALAPQLRTLRPSE